MIDHTYGNSDGRIQRFRQGRRCPVCGGQDLDPRGVGRRCMGFLSSDGDYIHCSREEYAGGLEQETAGTYAHKAHGACRCGMAHGAPLAQEPTTIAATYDYRAADGSLLFQVVRREPKSFRQRRPDGQGGWAWNLHGIEPVLYRLPELLAERERVVFLVEGEKDANALGRLGLVATTAAMGAGKWRPSYTDALRGRGVVLIGDSDVPGRRHAEQVAAQLAGVARWVRIIDLAPDKDDGYDVSDWLAEGHTRAELEAIAADAPPLAPAATKPTQQQQQRPLPATQTATELLARDFPEPAWAVPHLLPEGLTLFVGSPKIGKSWFMLDVVRAVAAGATALGYADCTAGDALYLALEDGERLLQRRLRKQGTSGAGGDRLHIATSWHRFDDGGREDLDAWLTAHPSCRLVVIDTLARIRPREQPGGGVYRQDYEALAPLADLARAHHCAIVVVHHTRKMQSEDVLDLVSGSNGLAGSVDAIMVLQRARLGDEAVLTITGRDVEEQALACAFDRETCHWRVEGEASAVQVSQLQQEILEALVDEERALRAGDIADRLGRQNDSSLRHVLCKMVKEGLLTRGVRGMYGLTAGAVQRVAGAVKRFVGQLPLMKNAAVVATCDDVIDCDRRDRDLQAPGGDIDEPEHDGGEPPPSITPITSRQAITTDHKPAPCPGCGRRYTAAPAPNDPEQRICRHCGSDLPDEGRDDDV